MMKFQKLVSIIAVYLIYINAKCFGNFIDDYSWRDYDGITPKDALKAGMDRSGQPIYIGQTLFENKLVPGKIHHEAAEIHIEFHTVHTINETIKILCTPYPEKFEWFSTRGAEVLNIKGKHIFEGGYEKGYVTYIGRALSHGEMTVGKVVCSEVFCHTLTTIEDGQWYRQDRFEILIYNPDAKVDSTFAPPTTTPPPVASPSVTPPTAPEGFHNLRTPNKPGFWSYFMLVVTIVALAALVVVLVRKC